jgi:RNase P/RNase MRP subunit p30
MPSRTAKKRKANPKHAPCIHDGATSRKKYYNLMVPIPQGDSNERFLLMQHAVDRLASIGYTHMAFCHTVYGKVKPDDNAETSLGVRISKLNQKGIQILKRLHVVVENLSDVGHYTAETDSIKPILQDYDLVSMAPRNDSAFSAACSTATLIDVVTLDYTSGRGGVQLPYKIRTVDVKAACKRGAVFELFYSPAILTLGQRKAMVGTAAALQSSSLGSKPKVLFSSGDSNAMSLRAPGDLINLMTTVLQFNPTTAYASLGETGEHIVETARRRKFGTLADVYLEDDGPTRLALVSEETKASKQADGNVEASTIHTSIKKRVIQEDIGIEDGFITF